MGPSIAAPGPARSRQPPGAQPASPMISAAISATARPSVATRCTQAERTVVGPHRGEVPLGQVVLLRWRVGHVEVVTLDQAVPNAGGRQLGVDLIADAALASPPAGRRQTAPRSVRSPPRS